MAWWPSWRQINQEEYLAILLNFGKAKRRRVRGEQFVQKVEEWKARLSVFPGNRVHLQRST
jgi:hypothetical protein